jgi:hypothetical protein
MIFYEKNLILDPLLIQVFPQLLSTLLEKDFVASVHSDFEATGLYPVSGTAVQKQLLKI